MPRPSPFDALERSFRLLTCEPAPLAVDGRQVGHGLPGRLIPLDQLRELLLDPAVPYAARDAALLVLVQRAQRDGEAWMVGLAGVLLPGLRRAAERLTRACPGKAEDLQAAVLAGLLEAVAAFPTANGNGQPPAQVAARLIRTARGAGRRLLEVEVAWLGRHAPYDASVEPPQPARHPDLVLARAVRQGVLSRTDAEVIGETRVGEVPRPPPHRLRAQKTSATVPVSKPTSSSLIEPGK